MTDQELQLEAQDIFQQQDSQEAIQLIGQLKREPTLGAYPQTLLQQLQYIRISSLSPDQLLNLLKNYFFLAYSIPDYNLAEKIEWYISQIDRIIDQVEVCRKIQSIIENHTDPFTNNQLIIKNQTLPATIANWLADYNSYPGKEALKGAIDEIEYLNKSPNVKKLLPNEKEVLKNILKLYDYCKNAIAEWDAIPMPANETEAFKEYDLYKYIPGLDYEDDDTEVIEKTDPEIELRRLAPKIKMADFDSVRSTPHANIVPPKANPTPSPEPAQEPIPAPVPRTAPPKNPVHLAAPTNYDEIVSQLPKIKRGVVMDPTNIKITEEKQRMELEKNSQAKHIQQKLAELRKRNNEKS